MSLAATIPISTFLVSISTLYLLSAGKIDYDLIAHVTFVDPQKVLVSEIRPISEVQTVVEEHKSSNVVLEAYVTSLKEACSKGDKAVFDENNIEQTVIVYEDGKSSVGKATLGPESCDIIRKKHALSQRVYTASDTAISPDSQKKYVTIVRR